MPGFSYFDLADIFRSGGQVLGRPWGRRYDSSCGCQNGGQSRLVPDCTDYEIESGYVPPCPPRCKSSVPVRLRVIG